MRRAFSYRSTSSGSSARPCRDTFALYASSRPRSSARTASGAVTAVNDSRARSSSSSAFCSRDSSSGDSRCHWACRRYSAAAATCSCNAVGGPLTTGTSVAAIFASTSPRAVRASARVRSARESTSRSRTMRFSASCRTASTASISRRTSSRARASRSYTVVSGLPPPGAELPSAFFQKASGSETTCSRSLVSVRVMRSRSSPAGCSPGRTPTECASVLVRRSSAESRSIRAGSADHTASAATTMSSEAAYSSFMRSTRAASE